MSAVGAILVRLRVGTARNLVSTVGDIIRRAYPAPENTGRALRSLSLSGRDGAQPSIIAMKRLSEVLPRQRRTAMECGVQSYVPPVGRRLASLPPPARTHCHESTADSTG